MGAARLQADIAGVIVHATFWTSLLFIPAVSLVWPWWRHEFGRAMMSIDVLLVLAFLPGVLRLTFGIPLAAAWFGWLSLAVLACIPARTAWLTAAIWRIQREEKADGG